MMFFLKARGKSEWKKRKREERDHGDTKMLPDKAQTEMTGFVEPYVTFKDEIFPNYGEAITEN